MIQAIAPGKLILSGEHAVVYGKPALVLAVNRYVETTIIEQPLPEISLDLPDLQSRYTIAIAELAEARRALLARYQLFLQGQIGIRNVLRQPYELFQYALATLIDDGKLVPETGLGITLKSSIPIGSGMGSSAAAIVSLIYGLTGYFGKELSRENIYGYCLAAEQLQHGHPSGVDPYVCLHGGFVRFQQKKARPLSPPDLPMFLVDTGQPQASTGECVSLVAKYFRNSDIWDRFESTTDEIEQALGQNDGPTLRRSIKENHRLLYTIGVVPEQVADFIAEIETCGAAAKISGAGSVAGDSAGMVIVFADENPDIICQKYGYSMIPIQGEPRGARII